MVARFYSRQDYLKVLSGGPWMVLGHYLTITKWRPNFKPSTMEVHTTLAWVRFPTLPLENFDDQSLLRIGNAVGQAVKVDSHTVDVTKGKYARVCVELNLQQPLVPTVLVWGRKQPVEYEGLPKICFKCGRHGHKLEHCDRQHPQHPATEQAPPPTNGGTVDNPFGPWMLPAHERRRLQQLQARMNRKVQPSEANRRLNAQLDKQGSGAPPEAPPSDGSASFVFGSGHTNRDLAARSAQQKGSWGTDNLVGSISSQMTR